MRALLLLGFGFLWVLWLFLVVNKILFVSAFPVYSIWNIHRLLSTFTLLFKYFSLCCKDWCLTSVSFSAFVLNLQNKKNKKIILKKRVFIMKWKEKIFVYFFSVNCPLYISPPVINPSICKPKYTCMYIKPPQVSLRLAFLVLNLICYKILSWKPVI